MPTGEELKQNAACTMPHTPKARCWQDHVVICQPTVLADLRPIIQRCAYGGLYNGNCASRKLAL